MNIWTAPAPKGSEYALPANVDYCCDSAKQHDGVLFRLNANQTTVVMDTPQYNEVPIRFCPFCSHPIRIALA
jgi:hypothetical protein